MRRLGLLALTLLSGWPMLARAGDWGDFAIVSTTMGVSGSRVCIGEASRGDIGCPTYAPTVSPTGTLNVTSGMAANQISLTTGGTTWGYLASTASYVPTLNAGTISATTVRTSTPVAGNDAATKNYVDVAVAAAGGGGSVVCAATRTAYTGDLGGLSGADNKCVQEFGTGWKFAHFNTVLMSSGNLVAGNAGYGPTYSANPTWAHYPSGQNCSNWTSSDSSMFGTNLVGTGNWPCNNPYSIACCKH